MHDIPRDLIKKIDLILEAGGELHPIEAKRSANPRPETIRTSKALDKGTLKRKAVLLSAADRNNYIIPAWLL